MLQRSAKRARVGTAAIALLVVGSPTFGVAGAGQGGVPPEILSSIARIEAAKDKLGPAEQKMSSPLLQAVEAQPTQLQGKDQAAQAPPAFPGAKFDAVGRIQIYVHLNAFSDQNVQVLKDLGLEVEIADQQFLLVQGWCEPEAVRDLAGLPFVRLVTLPDYGIPQTGGVTSEGDSILGTSLVRSHLGVDGTGVTVGVISNGITNRYQAQLTGDLPSDYRIIIGKVGSGDEGTAMLEIVHDLAPGANLAFYGPSTSLDMVNAIQFLSQYSDVIVDDVIYFDQPFFEDGMVAQAAAQAVASGVTFLASAGNSGHAFYEGDFLSSGVTNAFGNPFHDFGGGDLALDIRIPANQEGSAVLQWSDCFGSSSNDYNLMLYDRTDWSLTSMSIGVQNGTQNPVETISWGALPFERQGALLVFKSSGSKRRLKLLIYRADVLEHAASAGSVLGHAAATSVLAVGAISALDPGSDTIEPFSSQGPVNMYCATREARLKPDLTAIDNVLITGAGGFPYPGTGGGVRFQGTSAAAPHAAGVAALILSANPTLSPAEVGNIMKNTAVDLGPPGADNIFGYGRIDAFAAVSAASPGESQSNYNVNATCAWVSPTRANSCSDSFTVTLLETSPAVEDMGWTFKDCTVTGQPATGAINVGLCRWTRFADGAYNLTYFRFNWKTFGDPNPAGVFGQFNLLNDTGQGNWVRFYSVDGTTAGIEGAASGTLTY